MLESLWFYQWAISTLSHILHWVIFCTEPYPALSHILLWATSCTEPYLTLSHTVPHPALNHSCTEPYPVLSHILCWAILTLNNIYWATSTLNHILYWVISCMEPYSTLSYIPHRATPSTEPHLTLNHILHRATSCTESYPTMSHTPHWYWHIAKLPTCLLPFPMPSHTQRSIYVGRRSEKKEEVAWTEKPEISDIQTSMSLQEFTIKTSIQKGPRNTSLCHAILNMRINYPLCHTW